MNLAMANIRKSKYATVSLFIFILIAGLLLNMGLMVNTQLNAFFDQKNEQLKDPHVTFVMDQASYHSAHNEYLANYSGIKETETEEIIDMHVAKVIFGNGELTDSFVILNADTKRTIGPLNLIERLTTTSINDIYVPYIFKTNGGYKLGDDFTITYQDRDYDYRIAGFLETTMMGTNNNGVMKFMLVENAYQSLADELGHQSKGLIISVVMEDKKQSSKLINDFFQNVKKPQVEESNSYIWGLDIEQLKNVDSLTINIIATILIAFSAIIVIVSLIVIKFRISNNIEDEMENIGILKSIGYTSRQILLSIILQYFLITLSASIVGIALSYALMPLIGNIISTLSGLIWIHSFDIIINLISIFFVTLCVVIVTLLSAFRVRKILPVAALRGGIQTHSFRKNYIPLEKAKGSLHFLLAIKSMLGNVKQNIMILLIIMALTFVTVFSVVLYYNIALDKTAFVNLFETEPSNVYIAVKPDADTRELLSDIEEMDHVRKVNIFDTIKLKIDGKDVYTNVTDQYNQLDNNIVYEGRQPKYENEISISWVVSSQINKGIGDTVDVEYGAETKSYLITGLSQIIGDFGRTASLTMEGIQQLQLDYKGTTLYVYLDNISNNDFIHNIQKQYGDNIVETLDIDKKIESQTSMYTDAVFAIMVIVLTITVLVVVIILYLVIKTMITKRKKEFGVMKAIGYSTFQLMNQISISLLPIIITGVGIGGLLGIFFTNPMFSVLLSNAGIKRLEFIIHLPIIAMVCVGILILSYIVSMVVSLKIKKISAYSLITE
ncbi:FtsX-like permease family protein [Heyndrickxia sp. NPDC080065]|uniref:ABC transporter permease n=1 Tax=Heyndrickxia sp. NPDC080065 TaxID=3390568 RepID=UPI003D0044AF